VYELGLQYAAGYGVQQDLVFAEELLRFVYDGGYVDAACALGYVLADQGAMEEARAFWEVGVCNNCVSSLHNLGVLYGNQGKLAKAKALLSDTSRKGSQESTLELEAINRRGEDNM
jgi:TPR repeat protein